MENNEIITGERWAKAVYIFESGVTIEFPDYMVSDHGRVKSLNYNHTGKERIMKQQNNGKYRKNKVMWYKVVLRKDGKPYILSTHRLALSSFDPEGWKPGYIVNHKTERNENSCINEFSNLEWTTQKDNVNTEHCRESKSKTLTNRKDLSKRVRVTFSDGTIEEYPSAKEAGRALGISPKMVSTLINQCGGYYKKLGLYFEYID